MHGGQEVTATAERTLDKQSPIGRGSRSGERELEREGKIETMCVYLCLRVDLNFYLG